MRRVKTRRFGDRNVLARATDAIQETGPPLIARCIPTPASVVALVVAAVDVVAAEAEAEAAIRMLRNGSNNNINRI